MQKLIQTIDLLSTVIDLNRFSTFWQYYNESFSSLMKRFLIIAKIVFLSVLEHSFSRSILVLSILWTGAYPVHRSHLLVRVSVTA